MDKEKAINRIIEVCDRDDQIVISEAYGDGGLEPLSPRLIRAALNQVDDGKATMPRYGIWANTVRDNIRHALDLIDNGRSEEANSFLIRAANSLSAFAEIQAMNDPMGIGHQTIGL